MDYCSDCEELVQTESGEYGEAVCSQCLEEIE